MGKRKRKSVWDWVVEKILTLVAADRKFKEDVSSTESDINRQVMKFQRSFDIKDGNYEQTERNSRLLVEVRRNINEIIAKSKMPKTTETFLTNFDELEQINTGIYGQIVGSSFQLPNTSVYRRQLTNFVVSQLADIGVLQKTYGNEISQIIFETVNLGVPVGNGEERIRDFIMGADRKGGQLAGRAAQIARDTVAGYDGYIQEQILKKYNFDGFFYLGSIIDTSRENCIEMLQGTGRFAQFAVKPGLYRVEDKQKIINAGRGRSGFNDAVTPEIFAVIRFGWNCRHSVLYTRLSKDEINSQISTNMQEINA